MRVLYLILLMCLYAKGEEGNNCVGDDVDEYLDKVLEKVKSEMPNPLPLPSKEGDTEKDVTLTEGVSWGIDTLKRTGSAKVTCDDSGVTIEAVLGVDEMSGRYKWEKYVKSIFSRRRTGFVFIKSEVFEMEVVVTQKRDENANVILESFKVSKMEDIDVEITGMNYLTWIASHILDPVVNFFKHGVVTFCEENIKLAVERALVNVRIPFN